jgi:arabinoxylan arabinofuranohydrolase
MSANPFKPLIPGLLMLLAVPAARGEDGGYLFATFKGEQSPMTEQVYFGLSRDGRQWRALNGGSPVLISTLGEKGVRDPYLLRSHDGKSFRLLATDLSIHLNRDWNRAQTAGSKSIVIWESDDLVTWNAPRLVKVAADDAGCTWAPEAVFDEETRDYLVFWASKNQRDAFAKQRIWAAHTKDFRSFGKPFVYIDRPNHVIDTTIVRNNGQYYRFSKDEQFKAITMEVSNKVAGPWKDVPGFSLTHLQGYEGPECYPLKPAAVGKDTVWCLVLDYYSKGKGYQPFVTDDLSAGRFSPGPDFSFPFHFRHGSILVVTEEEYRRLEAKYGG